MNIPSVLQFYCKYSSCVDNLTLLMKIITFSWLNQFLYIKSLTIYHIDLSEITSHFEKFETDNESQVTLQKFLPKLTNHFIKSKTQNIRIFLNTFKTLVNDHIPKSAKDDFKKSPLEKEKNDEFTMYLLYKAFGKLQHRYFHASVRLVSNRIRTILFANVYKSFMK